MTKLRLFVLLGALASGACDPVLGVPQEYDTQPPDGADTSTESQTQTDSDT